MTNLKTAIAFVGTLLTVTPTGAWAHAFLKNAVPGAGTTVSGSPNELQLTFTEGVVVALSNVKIAAASGGGIGATKPTANSSTTLSVHLNRALTPGTYIVTWHVVSVDSHPTSGSYKFTIAH